MRAIVIFATLTAVVLARPDVSHLNGYKYNQPSNGAPNGLATGNSFTNAGAGFSGGNNELESLNNSNDKGNVEELSSTSVGITSYDAPYVSGNNYQGGYTDSASFGSSAPGVISGAPLEEVSIQVSSSGSADGIAGSGYSSESTGLDGGSIGLSGGSNGFSGNGDSSNGFSAGSNGDSSNGFSAGSNGGSSNGFSAGSNGGSSNGFSAGSNGDIPNRFSGSNGGQNGGINLIQGQSQTFDLTGGSNGPPRVVYKPVIKQGEPIITKNFYVHAAPEEDENVRVEEKVHFVRPQKTYKIIFIKAPSIGSSLSSANYPVFPQNEEKTIVYVLSKKNDEITDIADIPTPPPAVTHKPEVFFIKYKTRQEAADAVANIQSQFQQESQSGSTAGLSIGGSSNGNSGNNIVITSTGSENGDGLEERITPDDIRDVTGETAFGVSPDGDDDIGGIQAITSSGSSETRAGPAGGQFEIQTSNFGSSGDLVLTQTGQVQAGDAIPVVDTQYIENTAGQGYSPDSTGSSAEQISQQFNSNRQAYLPPNARRFRF